MKLRELWFYRPGGFTSPFFLVSVLFLSATATFFQFFKCPVKPGTTLSLTRYLHGVKGLIAFDLDAFYPFVKGCNQRGDYGLIIKALFLKMRDRAFVFCGESGLMWA